MSIKPDYKLESLFGGQLLCVKSKSFVVFYDWASYTVIRRIDISPSKVIWDDTGSRLALVTNEGTFLLNFNINDVKENIDKLDP